MEMECICCGAELNGRNAFPMPLMNAMCSECVREVQTLIQLDATQAVNGEDWLDN